MKALNEIKWAEFYLKDIFTEILRGKRLKKSDHKNGGVPYVSSTSFNNGVDSFVGNEDKVRVFSNCLTIANSGSVGSTFFHNYSFVASDHVTQLKNESFNKYIYLFISIMVNRLGEKYSFNREINDIRIQREKILLPVNEKGEPDFNFMEDFMRRKEEKQINEFQEKLHSRLKESECHIVVEPLIDKKWGEFEIGKLFKLDQGKSKGLNHLKKENIGINYLGATNLNNGVLCQVEENKRLVQKGNCIAFIRNGEGSMGYSVYKAESFIATSDISVGYSEFLNRYVGLFITSVADKVRGKYNFGYKRSDKRLKKEKLLLPMNNIGEPDFEYMENFIKRLEYEKLSTYIEIKMTGN